MNKKYALVVTPETDKEKWECNIFSVAEQKLILKVIGSNIISKILKNEIEQVLFDIIKKMEDPLYTIRLICNSCEGFFMINGVSPGDNVYCPYCKLQNKITDLLEQK